jgi:hypothetical protein
MGEWENGSLWAQRPGTCVWSPMEHAAEPGDSRNEDQPHSPPVVGAAPASAGRPGEGEDQHSAWPALLGIVALVFGLIGLVMRVFSLLAILLMRAALSADAGEAEARGALIVSDRWFVWSAGSTIIGALLALLLLAGGIGLLRRNRGGARLLIIWAWTRIGFAVIESIITVLIQREQLAAAREGTETPMAEGVETGVVILAFIWTLSWGIVLPVIILLVLTMARTREEIAGWK